MVRGRATKGSHGSLPRGPSRLSRWVWMRIRVCCRFSYLNYKGINTGTNQKFLNSTFEMPRLLDLMNSEKSEEKGSTSALSLS